MDLNKFTIGLIMIVFNLSTLMVSCEIDRNKVLDDDDEVPSLKTIYHLRQFGPKAKIDSKSITISGYSSGAFMTMQFHLAYSKIIKGAGMFAGGPYARIYGNPVMISNLITGFLNLIKFRIFPSMKPVSEMVANTKTFEANGHIDPLSNINGSKVYVHQGDLDTTVKPIEGRHAAEMYSLFGADVKFVATANAGHVMPTANFGAPCEGLGIRSDIYEGVAFCHYEGIFDMFAKLDPDFIRPSCTSSRRPPGSYYHVFDQTPFVPTQHIESKAFMALAGYIYIPPGCQDEAATCKLHIALHSCFQSIYDDFQILENLFATRTGYTQAADANNYTIIFPQAAPIYFDAEHSNFGCWDFFGGTTTGFPFKTAPRIEVIYNIIANLTGFSAIP